MSTIQGVSGLEVSGARQDRQAEVLTPQASELIARLAGGAAVAGVGLDASIRHLPPGALVGSEPGHSLSRVR